MKSDDKWFWAMKSDKNCILEKIDMDASEPKWVNSVDI